MAISETLIFSWATSGQLHGWKQMNNRIIENGLTLFALLIGLVGVLVAIQGMFVA